MEAANNTNNTNRGIATGTDFFAFCQAHGNPRYVNDFPSEDGGTYCALSFSADTFTPSQRYTYVDKTTNETKVSSFVQVGFSSNLGELSMSEIVEQLADLQVVELKKDETHANASFKLCRKGEMPHQGEVLHIV